MLVELSDAAPAPVHKYVLYTPLPPAGVAVRVRFTPAHVSGAAGVIVTVGLASTVTVLLAEPLHPLLSVTVHVSA